MSHRVHPFAHRLGIIRDWKSRWFSTDKNYRDDLKGDLYVRRHIEKKYRGMFVAGVDIERTDKIIRIIIKSSRPGVLIGRSGEGALKIKNEISTILKKADILDNREVKIDIEEIRSPESNAMVVAHMVSDALEKRMTFRRVLKMTVEKVMANRDVKGVRIALAGRLGGAEMARREELKKGQIPLQTFRADIDYARYEAHMTYGQIGIKVWIYRGQIFNK